MTGRRVYPAGHGNTCFCFDCHVYRARRAADYRARRREAAGLLRGPAGPAQARVRWLRQSGLTINEIAYLSGVSRQVISGLAAGLTDMVGNDITLALSLTWPWEVPRPARHSLGGYTEARPSARLIEGLMAQGWRAADIEEATGILRETIRRLSQGEQPQMFTRTAILIEDFARTVGDQPGPSPITRARALAKGWLPLKWGTDAQIAEQCELYRCQPAELPEWAAREARGEVTRLPSESLREKIKARRALVLAARDAGMSIRETAENLRISERTVEADRRRTGENCATSAKSVSIEAETA